MIPFLRHPTARTARLALTAAGTILGAACSHNPTSSVRTVASLQVVQGNLMSAPVGTALTEPVVVIAKDASGNPVADVKVAFATGDGSLATATAQTDANGQAVTVWTLGTVAKLDTLAVSATAAPSVTPVTVVDTATPGPAAQVKIVSGGDQTGLEGTALAAPLVIQVLDSYGNPVPGVAVAFSDDQQGSFGSVTLTTDANGTVTDTFTLPMAAGVDDITVSVTASSGPVTATTEETASATGG